MVAVNSGKLEATYNFHEISKSKWNDLVKERRQFIKLNMTYDCRCLVRFYRDAEEYYEQLGYASIDDMIRNGYEIDPDDVRLAVTWLERHSPDDAISITAVKAAAADVMKAAPSEVGPGQGARTDLVGHSGDARKLSAEGTTSAYLAARLKRDAPDIAQAVERGEYKSMRAAAKAAGIVREKSTLDKLKALWVKATPQEQAAFLDFCGE